MYKDGWLTYNPDSLEKAITEASKMTSVVNNSLSSKYNSIESLIPSNFKSKNALLSVVDGLSGASGTNQYLIEIQTFLKTTYNELNKYVDKNYVSSEFLKLKGYFPTTINGVEGYLYIPPGDYTSTAGLPIITWLSGAGEFAWQDKLSKEGLPKLLNEGYNLNAVVWVPTGTVAGRFKESDFENIVSTINTLIDRYNLDSDRNSLIGYSLGGHGGFDYISKNPDYFSAFVTYGSYPLAYQYDNLANSSTTIMMFIGTEDEDAYGIACNGFRHLNERGADVLLYKIDGADHMNSDKIFSEEMINDLINIKKGETYTEPGKSETIEVSYSELVNSSISHKLSYGVSEVATFYKQLVPEDQKNQIDFEIEKEDANESLRPEVIHDTVVPELEDTVSEENNIVESDSYIKEETVKENEIVENLEPIKSVNLENKNTETTTNDIMKENEITADRPNQSTTYVNKTDNNNTKPTQITSITDNREPVIEETMEVNILPENKFSEVLPKLMHGELNSMEIGSSIVNYDVTNVGETNYNNYIDSLKEFGYTFVDGKWIKDNYEIVINYVNDNLGIHLSMK